MKRLALLLTFLFTQPSFSSCKIYIFNTSPLKENENLVFFEVSNKILKSKSYQVTNNLKESDYLAEFSLIPKLNNEEFVFHLSLKLTPKKGEVLKSATETQNLYQGFEKLINQIDECVN